MRRKNLRNLTCIALSAVMVAGLTACGGGDTATETTTAAPAATTAAETTAAGTAAPAETTAAGTEASAETTAAGTAEKTEGDGIHFTSAGGITYPLENTTSLSLYDVNNEMAPPSVYADYTESPFHTGLAERTGVNIEWQFLPAGGNATEAYNLLMTEDVLPDMIYKKSWKISDGVALMDDGVIWDLTDYLPVYAPDYWELIHRPENRVVLQTTMTDDNRLFSVSSILEGPYNTLFVGPIIRQDWLDECGLETPVTMQDWENVLVAFKEKYNVAPMSFSLGRINSGGFASGTGAYATFSGNWYADDNGQVQLAQLQPEWKEYMEWLHKWYDMGLIDKDVVSNDDATLHTKALNGQLGVTVDDMGVINDWNKDAEDEGSGAKWVGVGYPRVAPGQPANWTHTRSTCIGHGAVVTKSCSEEELIEALKWLNYGYTDEGITYWNFGTEGVSYELDEEGEPVWTDLIKNDPDGMTTAMMKYARANYNMLSVQTERFWRYMYGDESDQALTVWLDGSEAQKHYVRTRFTDDELKDYNDLWAPISTHISEVAVQYMTGDISLDSYDDFVKELSAMGVEEARNIMQAGYDRYMAK